MTAFLGYKAGMTHIVREVDRPGSSECVKTLRTGGAVMRPSTGGQNGLLALLKVET